MSYTTAEGRQQLLDEIAAAINRLGSAITSLGEAYELLDDQGADRLEEQMFRPAQLAYGRAKKAHGDFSDRVSMARRVFVAQGAEYSRANAGARGHIEHAINGVAGAGDLLGELQDTMLPVEVGDAQLRAALAEVRTMLADLPARGHQFIRLLGR